MAFQPLIPRLTTKLTKQGVPNARAEAVAQLQDFGLLKKGTEKLTKLGEERQAMGPAARAISRAAERSGHPESAYRFVGGRAILK